MTRARKTTLAHMQKLAAAALLTNVACDHGCGSGYAVVDPMPTPGRVYGVASSITATASWSGTRVVLVLKDPTATPSGSLTAVTFAAKSRPDAATGGYSVSGGRVMSATPTSDGLRLEIEPDAGRGAFYVQLEIDGADGGSVEATVSWGTSPDGGRSVGVTLQDR
jgi:hypothetical protein